ncbi:PREDICTED: farnesyl pyrophosphate synthase 1-like [Papilio polytes]|uniref:farnesyl pyrophosphate synthase 1-like n=1 Tax=Papilio polytes TaxID=76194 RepID=UPI00067628A4|nr:PREDICTED: farnesyl pyrophosphate synthase 1-like [Papilio polytes]
MIREKKEKWSRLVTDWYPRHGKRIKEDRTETSNCFTSLSKQFVDNYYDIFTKVVDEALARIPYLDSNEIKDRIKKMAGYYALERKPMLAELFLHAYEMLEQPENYNEEKKNQAYALACAMEMGTSYFLFIDDMEDDGKTRCGKPCWHLLPDAGPLTWNDTSMLRSFIHELLLQNFPETLSFRIVEFVNQIYFLSAVGQHLDISTSEKQNYKNFTVDYYYKINEVKVSFFAIQAPIIFALILANKDTNEAKQQVHNVCNDVGVFIQIKNDLMDLYDSNEFKSSTDIQKGKCSWLAVKALEICNKEQRKIFQENYGNWDKSCVRKIQELYDTLKIQDIYEEEKQTQYENFLKKINNLPSNAVPSADIYKKLISNDITIRDKNRGNLASFMLAGNETIISC